MKPGDLLIMRIDLAYMYEGEDVPWDKDGFLVPGKIPVPSGTIVVVVNEARKLNGDPRENVYYKILTPSGVGWVWCNYVKDAG